MTLSRRAFSSSSLLRRTLGDRTLDIALFDFGERHVGRIGCSLYVRTGMTSLAMTPWDQLVGLFAKYGALTGYDLPSRPTTVDVSSVRSDRRCTPALRSRASQFGRLGCRRGDTSGTRTWVDYWSSLDGLLEDRKPWQFRYEELTTVIQEQMVSRLIYPLQWFFKTIVSVLGC